MKRHHVYFLISCVCLILLWQLATWLFQIPPYVIPAPKMVVAAFWEGIKVPVSQPTGLQFHAIYTAYEALIGFGVGVTTGVLLALLFTEMPLLEKTVAPYVMAFQSLPKVAVAPLFLIWFGYGMTSKVMVIVMLTFFPLLVNTMEGIKSADVDQANLMTMLKATRWQQFVMVKLPATLPHILAGCKIAVVQAIVGALVGEFVGGNRGLGTLLLQRQSLADVAGVFAIFVVLSFMGFLGYGAIRLLEHRFLFWAHRLESQSH